MVHVEMYAIVFQLSSARGMDGSLKPLSLHKIRSGCMGRRGRNLWESRVLLSGIA